MIITEKNKHEYYSKLKSIIESCDTNIQLNNMKRFLRRIARQTIDHEGIYYSIGTPYKILSDLENVIKTKREQLWN